MERQVEIDDLENRVKENENHLNESILENEYLRDIAETEEVETYDVKENKFSVQLRHCIYSLLESHVSCTQVGNVINTVLSLVGKKTNKLPSRTTILRLNIERLVLAHK